MAEFLDLLREKGVAKWAGAFEPFGNIQVELALSDDNIEDARPGFEADSTACKCGHEPYEHMNGLCVHGCEPEKCAPPEEPEAPEVK